jgi:hypothetical protein
MLLIDEHIDGDTGRSVPTHLAVTDQGSLRVVVDGEDAGDVPFDALEAIVARYGKALADDVPLAGARLDLGLGRSLVRLRHLARYDVIARDFLVLVRPDAEPLAALSRAIAGPLVHVARAFAARSSPTPERRVDRR